MRFAVRDLRWIDSHLFHLLNSAMVVLRINRVRKHELCFALRAVDLDGYSDRWADQDSVRTFFGYNQASLLNTEFATETGRNYDRTSLADFAGFHNNNMPDYLNIGHSNIPCQSNPGKAPSTKFCLAKAPHVS